MENAPSGSSSTRQPPTLLAPQFKTPRFHTQLSSFISQLQPITPFPTQPVPPPFFSGIFPTPPGSTLKQQQHQLALDTPLPESDSDDDRLKTFVSLTDDDETRKRKENLAKRKYTRRGTRRCSKYPKQDKQ